MSFSRIFTLLCLLLSSYLSWGQIYDPVSWSYEAKKVGSNEYNLIFKAKIDNGWSIYSQYLDRDDGPIATSFNYDTGDHFETVGKNEESGNRKEAYDQIFEMNLIKFEKEAIFTQKIKVTDPSKEISGWLTFMTCDATKCLPPKDVDFKFDLASVADDAGGEEKPEEEQPKEETPEEEQPKEEEQPEESPKLSSTEKATPEAGETITLDATNANPQSGIFDPVKWSASVKKVSDNEYDIIFEATIEDTWYIYSQELSGDDGPYPTQLFFNEVEGVEFVGKPAETSAKMSKEFDKNFEMELIKLKKEAKYVQRVKVSDPAQLITGDLQFMTCQDSRCLAPAYPPFEVDLTNLTALIGEAALAGISSDNDKTTVDKAGADAIFTILADANTDTPAGQCGVYEPKSKSFLGIFILGLLGGFLALLTPCVFPMIPLTVSFFTKGSGDKKKGLTNALLYGFFIFLVYLALSVPFHLMDSINPNILNDISTNIWLNIAFFAIFIFFAFSFFGYYELTLPSSWSNRISAAEGIGGTLGIFFMALTLALVSFSCTGPILGSLLAGSLSADGGAMQLTSGMAGFGLALALPFALFAAFPNWLQSLPKSGGWLNTVKVVLGFAELALALKFLSNADLVKHWGLLKIEPFLALWILISILTGLYLLGKIKFPHDSPIKKLSTSRWILGLAFFAFAIYMATGFIYDKKAGSLKSLTLLSGLAPPACYSWFYPCDCPQNLNCFKDLNEGMAYAKEKNKPVMIDFTGHACVNCRKMEEQVWPNPKVYKYLDEDYVLISLYVDEKIALPEEEQQELYEKSGGAMRFRNTGSKWQYLQTSYFNNNSQPWYVLLSPEGDLLTDPVGYTPDEGKYSAFLQCGLEAFQQMSGKEVLGSND